MQVVVVGGGAAGIFAAIQAARAGAAVTVLEAGDEPLSKVRVSGGGRCNVSTAICDPRDLVRHYPRGAKELLGPLRRFGPHAMQAWLTAEGVALKSEADGRVFPASDDSATIVDCLLSAARRAGVAVRLCTPVRALRREGEDILVEHAGGMLPAPRLIMATGGDRTGHALAAGFGHTIIAPVPSLFSVRVDAAWLRTLAGVGVERVQLRVEGLEEPLSAEGPLLITHRGLSGPAVLRASAWGARLLAACGYRAELCIDWSGAGEAALRAAFDALRPSHGRQTVIGHTLAGIPHRLWRALCARAGVPRERCWAELTRIERADLITQVCACSLKLDGKGAFNEEFVTAGGVARDEIDWRTMASRRHPGLFLVGEMIDLDGLTGGFNFTAAWATGWLAGRAAAGA